MFATIFVGLLAVLLGAIARYPKSRFCFELAFILISIFLGIRYMWGNDMPVYYDMFYNFNNLYNGDVLDFDTYNYAKKENGWALINVLIGDYGFLTLQIILVVFENYIIYNFIKTKVSCNYYWFALFIYCFNPYFMVLSASMLRQYLAMILIIVATNFIVNKKIVPYLLLVFVAGSIHKTAFIFLPLYFLGNLNLKLSVRRILFIILCLFFWFLFAPNFFGDLILSVVNDNEDLDSFSYIVDAAGRGTMITGSGIGVIFKIFFVIVLIFKLPFFPRNSQIPAILVFISVLFVPLSSFSAAMLRLGFYFSIFSIVAYPVLMEHLNKNSVYRTFFLSMYVFFTLWSFFQFFYSPIWYKAFFEYQTIFTSSY